MVVERLGVETSERYVASAHILLACGESESSMKRTLSILSSISSAPVISVLTKSDLSPNGVTEPLETKLRDYVRVSAKTGEGLEQLQTKLDAVLTETYGVLEPELPVLTRARHIHGIKAARLEAG